MIWLLLVTSLLGYLAIRHIYSYWRRIGFPELEPQIPFGNIKNVAKQKQSFAAVVRDIHLKCKEPFIGLYFFFRPALLVRDAELAKRMMITDFDHFTDRGVFHDEAIDPVGAGIFSMPGQEWKDMRNKLSPTFTSGKLKTMFTAIMEKNSVLEKHLTEKAENSGEVFLKRATAQLNISIIASIFFGFELNVFAEPDHEFARIGDLFLDPKSTREKVKNIGTFLFPKLLKVLRIPTVSKQVGQYVLNLVNGVMAAREENPSLVRNDFIQTILKIMKEDKTMTVTKGAAQAFIFYLAGYETSAATSSFCVYELSKSPEWMRKVQEEVDELLARKKGNLEFEDLNSLKVLDMCVKETMRMYPSLPMLNRDCTKEYRIPGTDKVITKGTQVVISVYGLHMDEQHFSDPEKFDPSRFMDDNLEKSAPFYPFGAGPRFCVGGRLGLMMVKTAVVTMISGFNFEALDRNLDFETGTVNLTDKNNIHLKVTKRH